MRVIAVGDDRVEVFNEAESIEEESKQRYEIAGRSVVRADMLVVFNDQPK
jgi:hypothetical protein